MDDTALDWLLYALVLVVFIVISTIESRRAQRRDARARETTVRPPDPAANHDPHAWGRSRSIADAPAEWVPSIPSAFSAPIVVPASIEPQRGATWRSRLRDRGQLRDAVVMMTLLGPCASLERRRGPPHDPQ